MSIRTDLLAQLTTNLTAYTAFKVSSELPFDSAGEPLYLKNKKTVYLAQENKEVTQLIPVLGTTKIMQTQTTVNGYLTTDAKNQPSNIDSVITAILGSRTAISSTIDSTSVVETEITDDYITYSFEYTFVKL